MARGGEGRLEILGTLNIQIWIVHLLLKVQLSEPIISNLFF